VVPKNSTFFLTAQQQLAPQDNGVRPNYISKVKS